MLIVYSNVTYHTSFIDVILKNAFPADVKWEVYVLVGLQKSLSPTDPAQPRALPPAALPVLLYNAQRAFKVSARAPLSNLPVFMPRIHVPERCQRCQSLLLAQLRVLLPASPEQPECLLFLSSAPNRLEEFTPKFGCSLQSVYSNCRIITIGFLRARQTEHPAAPRRSYRAVS